MRFNHTRKEFVSASGQGPALVPAGSTVVEVGSDPDSEIFADHLVLAGADTVELATEIETGTDGFYGLDLRVRGVKCSDTNRCALALFGAIGLQLNPARSTVECVGYVNGVSERASEFKLNFQEEHTVGCYEYNQQLYLIVDGALASSTGNYDPNTTQKVGVAVGVMKSPLLAGQISGQVGRIRYWDDRAAMTAALQSGRSLRPGF